VNRPATRIAPRRRLIAWGLAACLAYLGVVSVSLSMGWIASRPLYDGLVPLPPYRWVNPPAERTQDNQAPQAETFKVRLAPEGLADPASVTTSDGQATVTFDHISPVEGESFVVTVTPQDPAQVAGPPQGSYFDSNAYKVEAAYEGSQAAVQGSFTIILRYSVHARQMFALKGGAWEALFQPLVTPIDLQVVARTPEGGTFVASGEGTRPPTGAEHGNLPGSQTGSAPYRWVNAPSGRAGDNQKPAPERFTIRVDRFGQTDPEMIATIDNQAGAIFNYVQPVEGQSSFDVVIEPLDPAKLAPAPQGQHFDGNAYRISATYPDSDAPITNAPSSVDFRYQGKAQQILVLDDAGWAELPNPSFRSANRVISARTSGSGIYVVAASGSPMAPEGSNWGWWFGLGSLMAAVAVGMTLARRRSKVTEVTTNPELL
jgi:hypothetical protein